MSNRTRLLVSLAKEKFEKNIRPNVISQCHELHPTISSLNQQTDRPISTILSNVIMTILIRVLSPSTSKVLIPENPEKNQLTDNFISPIQSNESDR